MMRAKLRAHCRSLCRFFYCVFYQYGPCCDGSKRYKNVATGLPLLKFCVAWAYEQALHAVGRLLFHGDIHG